MFWSDFDRVYNFLKKYFLKKYLNKKHINKRNYNDFFKLDGLDNNSDVNFKNFFFKINFNVFSNENIKIFKKKFIYNIYENRNIFINYYNFLKKLENQNNNFYNSIKLNFLNFIKQNCISINNNFKKFSNYKLENSKKIKYYYYYNFFLKYKKKFTILNNYKIIYKNYDLDLFNNKFKIKIFFLRKNKIFNKGRYSRNRQIYRTGVYLCLWINILMVYGLYYIFYKIVFNFNYLWFIFINFIFIFIFIKIFKYNLFNYKNIFKEIYLIINWYSLLIINLFNFFFLFLNNLKISNYLKNKNIINQNNFDYNFIESYKKELENNLI